MQHSGVITVNTKMATFCSKKKLQCKMNIHLQQSVNLYYLMKCIHSAVKYFLCLLKYNYKALKLITFNRDILLHSKNCVMFVKIIFDRVK